MMIALFSTAGSPPARHSAEYIGRIARNLNTDIVVLYVYANSHPAPDARQAFDVFTEAAVESGLSVQSRIQSSCCRWPTLLDNERTSIVKIVLVIIAVVFVMLAIFTAANWQVLTTVTPLSFVAFSVEGPLGVILLGVSVVLTLLVVAYALLLRTMWLVESRRINRQLEEQRVLAENAESSRIIALQDLLKIEFESLRASLQQVGDTSIAHIDTAEQSLAQAIEDASNSIMAHIGYLDDRLKGGSQLTDTDTESK